MTQNEKLMTVLQPVYAEAKAAYDRSHSHRHSRNLRDAATYLLMVENKMRIDNG